MKKTLAAALSAAMIGCANPEPSRIQQPEPLLPGEHVLTPVRPETPDHALTFFEQLLTASGIDEQDRPGHVTNLRTLEAAITESKKITPETPSAERLRAIHQYLFDHNAHRYAREAPVSELYELARAERIIAYDLEKGTRRVGSELGLALEYFVLAGRFGHQVTPYLVKRGSAKHIIFVGERQVIDAANPFGVSDLTDQNLGEQLTPANLLGLLLNTKGTSQVASGNLQDGYKTMERAYALYPCADITLNLGETATLLGNARLAKQWFEQTTRLDNDGYIAHERLGELSTVENDFKAAEQHFMRALERCSTRGILYAKYGETLFVLGRQDEARTFFRRALELEPTNESLKSGVQVYLDACRTR